MRFDGIDHKILKILLRAAGTPKAEIARQVGIAASAISERIRRLEDAEVIRGYEARLNARELGYPTLAYIFVTERKPAQGSNAGEQLSRVTGVEEVHKIAGEDCYLVKIRARDTEDLGAVLDNEINPIQSIVGTRTTIVLRTLKEEAALSGVDLSQFHELRARRSAD